MMLLATPPMLKMKGIDFQFSTGYIINYIMPELVNERAINVNKRIL